MSRSVKFAVSLSEEEFKELEALRKREGATRSKWVRQAIRLLKESKEREKLAGTYEKGYLRIPENVTEIEAWKQASLAVLSQEGWQFGTLAPGSRAFTTS